MFFGLSSGEVGLIVIAAFAAFGAKDVPIVARATGRVIGRAMGYLMAARQKFSVFAEKSQINELHRELDAALSQLQAIQHELRRSTAMVLSAKALYLTPRDQPEQQQQMVGQGLGLADGQGWEAVAGSSGSLSHTTSSSLPFHPQQIREAELLRGDGESSSSSSSAVAAARRGFASPAMSTGQQHFGLGLGGAHALESLQPAENSLLPVLSKPSPHPPLSAYTTASDSPELAASPPSLSSSCPSSVGINESTSTTPPSSSSSPSTGPFDPSMHQDLPSKSSSPVEAARKTESLSASNVTAVIDRERDGLLGQPLDSLSAFIQRGGVQVLPVSAETLGILPKRASEMEASDVMCDALMEQRVAYDALQLLSNSEQLPK